MARLHPSLCTNQPQPLLFFHFYRTEPSLTFTTPFPRRARNHSGLLSSTPGLSSRISRVSTVPVEYPSDKPTPDCDLLKEIAHLEFLKQKLSNLEGLEEKIQVLDMDSRVINFFNDEKTGHGGVISSLKLSCYELFLLKCLVAAGQEHVLQLSWVDLEHVSGLNSTIGGDPNVCESNTSSLKSAFHILLGMIEKWDLNGHDYWGRKRGKWFQEGRDEAGNDDIVASLRKLLKMLDEIEKFYDCIGGIIGYQIMALELLLPSKSDRQTVGWSPYQDDLKRSEFKEFHVPPGLDLYKNTEYASQAALWGIEGLPKLGEIYPMGGSGDRLGLVDPETGECLPTAMLPYCGRTLLEGLIRDLQAREFLYFKIYGKQCITPLAIMTSSAKNNHERISALCERKGWFGRGRTNFRLFEQPLVPAVDAEDGQWLITKPFCPVCKPSGHGVIWKLAYEKGVFRWFYAHGRKGATVRQVSNVVAATDLTLLALAGIGLHCGKKLGFASCKRNFGATEGINVLVERRTVDGHWAYGLSCIEYTEFKKFGIKDAPMSTDCLQAQFPANTNILYVDLASVEKVGSSKDRTSLPGMVLNLKKPIVYVDHLGMRHREHPDDLCQGFFSRLLGKRHRTDYLWINSTLSCANAVIRSKGILSNPWCYKLGNVVSVPLLEDKGQLLFKTLFLKLISVPGGRLECTMQNIADYFLNTYTTRCYNCVEEDLDTFIVFNERKRVTSSAKRKMRLLDKSLHQTPDGSLLDIIRNASDLLSHCNIKIPKVEDNSHYFHSGPPFLILLHPALGPLWEVTRQKFDGGSISKGSELQIEVSEFLWRDIQLDGSLVVVAENVMGSTRIVDNDEPILQYGRRCGRCKLQNVKIFNKGIDWNCSQNVYWKHDVQRHESLKIMLQGNAEFEATDVVLEGNHSFEVPNGYKLHITSGNTGLLTKLVPIKRELMDSGSWFWKYMLKGSHIHLEMVEL